MNQAFRKVRCARCDKSVDRVQVLYRNFDETYVVRVWCHGEMDEAKVSMAALELSPRQYRQLAESEGIAFGTLKLEAAQ